MTGVVPGFPVKFTAPLAVTFAVADSVPLTLNVAPLETLMFGLVAIGGTVGAIVGSWLLGAMRSGDWSVAGLTLKTATKVDPSWVMRGAIVPLELALWCVRSRSRDASAARAGGAGTGTGPNAEPSRGVAEGFKLIVSSRYLSLIGFYIVKNTIQRDEETRVGQILATTPMTKNFYTVAKMLSNFAVLASMIAVMAMSGVLMQWLKAEDPHVHLWALLSPFLLIALPAMAFTGALAVLFETVPGLRGGIGNVIYFFVWTALLAVPTLLSRT